MARLKSCMSCGRIHPTDIICPKRAESAKAYRQFYRKNNKSDTKDIRHSASWKRKAAEIRQRDLNICQLCRRSLYMLDGLKVYNYSDIQVHHITKIVDDPSRAFDNDNLITLCRYHHHLVENNPNYIKVLLDIVDEQEKQGEI